MIAKDYAGEGRVYSKEVPLDAVAWINSEEGQFSPADNKKYSEKVYPYDGETSKSRGIRKTAVYEFADSLGDMFNIVDRNGRDGMRKEAYHLADIVEKIGYIRKDEMDNFFDVAYQNARFTDDKSEYKDVKKRIRTAGIVPLGGREYLEFLQKYKGKIKFKNGGMPIDVLYSGLSGISSPLVG